MIMDLYVSEHDQQNGNALQTVQGFVSFFHVFTSFMLLTFQFITVIAEEQ